MFRRKGLALVAGILLVAGCRGVPAVRQQETAGPGVQQREPVTGGDVFGRIPEVVRRVEPSVVVVFTDIGEGSGVDRRWFLG